jgi:plastocyanin
MSRHITIFGAATLAAALLGAATGAGAPRIDAEIKLFQFQPKAITVSAGTIVTWTNRDAIEHSVTSGTPDAPTDDFDSGLFAQGKGFSVTFDQPGQYALFCTRHRSMRGTVTVTPAE